MTNQSPPARPDDKCAQCSLARREHHHDGAAYGICGKFVDKTARPDGDALLPCPFCGESAMTGRAESEKMMVFCANGHCKAKPWVIGHDPVDAGERWNTRSTSPARDAAEGERKMVSEIPFDPTNHHNALKCPYCNPEGLTFAPPKPAPDAVREARIAAAAALARKLCQLFDSGGESQRTVRARHASAIFQLLGSHETEQRQCDADPIGYLEQCERAALSAPVPPAKEVESESMFHDRMSDGATALRHAPVPPATVPNDSEDALLCPGGYWLGSDACRSCSCHASLPAAARAAEPVALADHDEISRKVLNQPWEVQSAIVTIAAHCTVLTDQCPTGLVADLAGCISQGCLELANALATPPVRGDRDAVIEECAKIAERAAKRCVREQTPGDSVATFCAQQIRLLLSRQPPQSGSDGEGR